MIRFRVNSSLLRSIFIIGNSTARAGLRFSSESPSKDYVQGQSPSPKIREYFYYIDHLGQLFLDDARMKNFTSCFKDKEFLVFFFSRLRTNESDRYADTFPYVSLCGRERNFVRCDDHPIVYTHIFDKSIPGTTDEKGTEPYIAYCNAGDRLAVKFEPEQLCMWPENGRVYYPASEKVGGVGLVRSLLAMELSPHFRYEDGKQDRPPSHLVWRGKEYRLTNSLWPLIRKRQR